MHVQLTAGKGMFQFILLLLLVLCSVIPSSWQVNSANSSDIVIIDQTRIHRITLSTQSIESWAPNNVSFINSIDFDGGSNCVYLNSFSVIARQCENGSTEILAQYDLNGSYLGYNSDLAYDWMSGVVYFYDVKAMRIEAMQRRPPNKDAWHRTILNIDGKSTVTSLHVHPKLGHLFWSQVNNDSRPYGTTVLRSHLDGSNARALLVKPLVVRPMQIAIDYTADRLYWTDTVLNYVASSDLNGDDFRIDCNDSSYDYQHPKSRMSVHNGTIYWLEVMYDGDAPKSTIWAIDCKRNETSRRIFYRAEGEIRDFKVIGAEKRMGTNACGDGRHNCTHMCVAAPNDQFTCLCPDGMSMTAQQTCECAAADELECWRRTRKCIGTHSFRCVSDGLCLDAYEF